MEVRFSKWFLRVRKGVINLFLCISMAYNVISCIEVDKNTQTLKIADFTMYVIWASDPHNHCFLGSRNSDLLNFFQKV